LTFAPFSDKSSTTSKLPEIQAAQRGLYSFSSVGKSKSKSSFYNSISIIEHLPRYAADAKGEIFSSRSVFE
jgi:hypothetical protein